MARRGRKSKKGILGKITDEWSDFELESETKKNVLALIGFVVGAVSVLSLFNMAGKFGFWLKPQLFMLFGWGAFVFPVIVALLSLMRLDPERFHVTKGRYFGILLLVLSGHGLMHLVAPIDKGLVLVDEGKGGGYLGWIVSYYLRVGIGNIAGAIILVAVFLIGFMLVTNYSIAEVLAKFHGSKKEDNKEEEEPEDKIESEIEEEQSEAESGKHLPVFATRLMDSVKLTGKRTVDLREEVKQQKISLPPYEKPPLSLLSDVTTKPAGGDVKKNQMIIQKTLENFGIPVAMGEIHVGPTVTQYTLKPEEGVKLAKITALHNDLALALSAHPVRIEAPIPGKSLVGIEVPNKAVEVVRLRGLIQSREFQQGGALPIVVGKDVTGQSIIADLAKMPHLLVAGATGSGKSVMINDLIVSLLYKNGPAMLRLIMIDPKRVELSLYNGIPHLLTPVIVESEKAINALRWSVGEMERRYNVLSEARKRDIASYNASRHGEEIMPFVVIVIDELAEIMAKYGREVEGAIVRLAQMARAVGMHLVVSTQRPSVDVITGLIKANITSRVAFNVASLVDSRTIIDSAGAEKLLGNGDMLFQKGDISKPRRLQAAYVSEDEVKRIVDFLSVSETQYDSSIVSHQQTLGGGGNGSNGGFGGDGDVDDALIEEATRVVRESKRASTSLLQRRLRVGYSRAARIIDVLEQRGVVGPADGSRPREVLEAAEEMVEKVAPSLPSEPNNPEPEDDSDTIESYNFDEED